MLKQLGNLIEKHPGLVIGIILLITIGFATLIPSLELKTDFSDFMPDNETVEANQRISSYFGRGRLSFFIYVSKQNTESVITPETIREQHVIQQELLEMENAKEALGLPLFINEICLLEFGQPLKNCTDEQIKIALNDILEDTPKQINILKQDDVNEEIDYQPYPRISKGKSIDCIDIQNGQVSYDNESITFKIKLYDLSDLEEKLVSPVPWSNVFEWYIDFENLIKPDQRLNISYKLAAHLEPKHAIWELGKGPLKNIQELINTIKQRELFNTYTKQVYLWIRPPGMEQYFPLPLQQAQLDFDFQQDIIEINVTKEEIGKYGINPRYLSYELPAKLSKYSIGSRYYQTPILKLPWLRINTNSNFILETLQKIMNRPLLGDIASRILENMADMTWEEFSTFFNMSNNYISIPDQLALKDIESYWQTADTAPDEGTSENILFIKSYLFEDLRVNIKAFLSKEYDINKKPSHSLIILNFLRPKSFEQNQQITKKLLNQVEELNEQNNFLTLEVTGDSVISSQMTEVTEEANQIIMPMIFVIIIIILFISFRKISYTLLPFLALIISTIWLFGTMVLLDIPFTTIAVAIVPLVMGLGVDYSVHISHNYRIEIAKGKTPAQAIKTTVSEIGTAMFLAMVTTAIAFLSFLSASIPPIRDFGLLLALGILYTFITALTLVTSVRYIIDRRKKTLNNRKKKQAYEISKFMRSFAKIILSHQKKIIVILLVVTLIGAYGALQIKTGFNFDSFVPEDNPAIEIFEKIQTNFPYAGQDQEYLLLEGNVDTIETIKGIRKTHENLEDNTFVSRNIDGSIKSDSIYLIIKEAAKSNQSIIGKFNLNPDTYIPKTDNNLKNLLDYLWNTPEYGMLVQNTIHKNDAGKYDATILRIYVEITTEGRESASLEKDLQVMISDFREDLADYGNVEVTITGPLVIVHVITQSLTESQLISTAISLILATIVLIVAYRKLSLGLIAMIPVMISMIWILGTMHFIGYSLNVLTITVTALTIGIGIDYAIHATERFKLVADKTGEINTAVTETISKTGGALLIAALTTAIGFAILIFAPIPPQVQFGVITSMTICYSFISSVLLLPLILARWGSWSKKRKGYIISKKPAEEEYIEEIKNYDLKKKK